MFERWFSWRGIGNWRRDLEIVRRRLRQKPVFAISVLITLSVGLGTFAVVFAAVDKILLEPLPYKNAGDLYVIWEKLKDAEPIITGPDVANLQQAGGAIESAAGMQMAPLNIPGDGQREARRITAMQVSPGLFDLLGVRPALGRGFRPDETGATSPNVIVLTDELWKRLGENRNILNTELKIGKLPPFTVIGVLPAGFHFNGSWGSPPDAYIPLYVNLATELPNNHDYRGIIRARHGASPEEVRRAVESTGRLNRDDIHQGTVRNLYPVGLQTDIAREVRPVLLALSFAVALLLLLLALNLASLLLARAVEREREFAVSRALGASRPAVVRVTLIEGTVLGLAGGITAVLAGIWSTRLLVALGPENLPRREAIAVDWRVAAVVISVGALLGLAAAAAPALWASHVSLESLLSGSAVRGAAGSSRMRRGLIVVQVALSLVLLSAGGLVVRSFERLVSSNPGFRPDGVLTFNIALTAEASESIAFQDRLDPVLNALPGVTHVSATRTLPLSGGANLTVVTIPGSPDEVAVDRVFTRAGYIETMGMRLLAGRGFEPAHRQGVQEAVIDHHLAQRLFPNRNPIGAIIRCEDRSITIVGVVAQARLSALHEDGRPQLMVRVEDYNNRQTSYYVIRTDRDPHALIPEVHRAISQLNPEVPISEVQTMDEIVAERSSRERISAVMISGLALGALLLVSMGLFGMISGSVARRRGELAVRMALGATHGRTIRLVVREGAQLIAFGLILAIPGIDIAGRSLQSLLIGVSPFDIPTIGAVAIALAGVALLACYLAARRVTTIDLERLLREGG
jgi:predicted permease